MGCQGIAAKLRWLLWTLAIIAAAGEESKGQG